MVLYLMAEVFCFFSNVMMSKKDGLGDTMTIEPTKKGGSKLDPPYYFIVGDIANM